MSYSSNFEVLRRRAGVTRLARLTSLDRTGIEVYAAVRPRGHVLQVSQGKGLTHDQARWSALGEAVELAMAERLETTHMQFDSARTHEGAWALGAERVAWLTGHRLRDGAATRVPAQAVLCLPEGIAWLGPRSRTWSSNGLGFHPTSRQRAVEHAVCELIERDSLARALPHGFTPDEALRRLAVAPRWCDTLETRGFAAFVFDVSTGRMPVAAALLFDLEDRVIPLTAGYACRRHFSDAATAAVLEAAQSRVTEIHGAREDVVTGTREAGADLLRVLRGIRPVRKGPPSYRGSLARAVDDPIDVVALSERPFVVKAVSPTMMVSELL